MPTIIPGTSAGALFIHVQAVEQYYRVRTDMQGFPAELRKLTDKQVKKLLSSSDYKKLKPVQE